MIEFYGEGARNLMKFNIFVPFLLSDETFSTRKYLKLNFLEVKRKNEKLVDKKTNKNSKNPKI